MIIKIFNKNVINSAEEKLLSPIVILNFFDSNEISSFPISFQCLCPYSLLFCLFHSFSNKMCRILEPCLTCTEDFSLALQIMLYFNQF